MIPKSLSRLLGALALTSTVSAPALAGPLQTPEQMLAYLDQHRQDVAVAAYTVRPDGTPDPADSVLFLNADRKMPLGSTFKVVVLAAYAREVVAGLLDPDAQVGLPGHPHGSIWVRRRPGPDGDPRRGWRHLLRRADGAGRGIRPPSAADPGQPTVTSPVK